MSPDPPSTEVLSRKWVKYQFWANCPFKGADIKCPLSLLFSYTGRPAHIIHTRQAAARKGGEKKKNLKQLLGGKFLCLTFDSGGQVYSCGPSTWCTKCGGQRSRLSTLAGKWLMWEHRRVEPWALHHERKKKQKTKLFLSSHCSRTFYFSKPRTSVFSEAFPPPFKTQTFLPKVSINSPVCCWR